MTGGEAEQKKGEGKGFAGLSSLVSDVDTTPPPAAKTEPAAPAPSSGPPAPQAAQQQSSQQNQTYQEPAQPSSSGSSGGKWVLGIAAVIGVLWLIGQSDKSSTSPVPAYSPPAQTSQTSQTSQTATPSYSPPAEPQAPSRPQESMPPVGQDLVFSTAQIRYCLAEDIRLEGAKSAVNNYIDSDVDRFNAMVADYNSRCARFRYRSGALESARRDIDPYRSQLQAEGMSRFARSPSTGSISTPAPARPAPDATVQAIQQRLNELGYNAGTADGLIGRGTRSAIIAFQQDRGTAATGIADQALLLQLQQASSRSSIGSGGIPESAARKPGRQCSYSSDCPGSYQCLDGQCRSPRVDGERCSFSSECAGSNQCLDGVCRQARASRERCTYSSECAGANQCLDGQCRPARVTGERCIYSSECAGANQCLDAQCRPARSAGEQCISSSECAGMNDCIKGRCQRRL